jgi:hypothetical protein
LYNFINILVSEKAKRAPVAKETEEEIKRRAIEEYIKNQQAAESANSDSATGDQQDDSADQS